MMTTFPLPRILAADLETERTCQCGMPVHPANPNLCASCLLDGPHSQIASVEREKDREYARRLEHAHVAVNKIEAREKRNRWDRLFGAVLVVSVFCLLLFRSMAVVAVCVTTGIFAAVWIENHGGWGE